MRPLPKKACAGVRNTKAVSSDKTSNFEGIFLTKWKLQRFLLPLNGRMPPSDPPLYSPLCMVDTASKTTDPIIQTRIEAVVEPILAGNEYGFEEVFVHLIPSTL